MTEKKEFKGSSDVRRFATPSGRDMEKMFHEMSLADLVDRIENYNSFESIGGPLRLCVDWQVLKARILAPPPSPGQESERTAQLRAHRACLNEEHDPQNGKISGFCVICGVPWPCVTAGSKGGQS